MAREHERPSRFRSWRCLFRVSVAVCSVFAALVPVHAINLQLTTADIDRALVIARGRDAERARFHAPYIQSFGGPFVERVEVVTQFRRVVLLAEEHILKGDRGLAYSTRLAQDAVRPWNRRVSVIVRLRFHPQNTYLSVPQVDVSLDGPNAAAAFVGLLKDPVYALSDLPGAPLAGAVVEGVFDASVIGQTQRGVTIRMDGKELATARVDFSAIE